MGHKDGLQPGEISHGICVECAQKMVLEEGDGNGDRDTGHLPGVPDGQGDTKGSGTRGRRNRAGGNQVRRP